MGKIHKELGSRLQALRKQKGFTQESFAEAVGLGRSYLAEIEMGRRNPTLDSLKLIADGLQVPLSKLLAGL
jgi:transcriptional regulator with XRE-family HTH domain